MGPRDPGGSLKVLEMIVPTVPSGTAGATNGSAVDTLPYDGRAICHFSSLSAGTGNTVKFEVQTADDSSFTANAALTTLYSVGSSAAVTNTTNITSAAATAVNSVVEVDLGACRRYVRVIVTTAGTTILGAVHAVMIAAGHHVLGPSGPGTTS